MAMAENIVESIPDEVDVYAPMLQQSIIKDDFDNEYLPVNAIQQGAPIEFSIKSGDEYYLDLNDLRMVVTAKITKANGADMDDNVRASTVNLLLHSLFREISATLNDTPVSDPNPDYPYRALLETILNFSEDTQKTRLITEGFYKDTAGHMAVNEMGRHEHWSERSCYAVKQKRSHRDGRSPSPRHISPESSSTSRSHTAHKAHSFIEPVRVHKSCSAGANAVQEQFKAVIQSVSFLIRTKRLSDAPDLSIRKIWQERNMKLPYSKVQVKHLTIPANVTSQDFDGIFDGVYRTSWSLALSPTRILQAITTPTHSIFKRST